ncbi:MAG TPA: DUF3142 domain-containing protein [Bryobacteraceae bacterium]|nr:DUF3142 domain-containing protein [Bryobacteraceae bacterium]
MPDNTVVSMLAERFAELQARARARHLNVAGVQLDIDSPTSALPQYAAFLREVRKGLPDGWRLSITALLDWFRSGTSVGDVIRETDEFVPQFYDIDAATWNNSAAVAARIDAARWRPVFNRFGKRFRIGISTFGRARFVPRDFSSGARLSGLASYRDLTPLDIALNPAFRLRTERNPANELVLNYEATRKLRIGYTDLNPGDVIQFILATPEAVRDAVAGARRIGGNLTGVVFFRWPQARELLAMQPDEALMAAGLAPVKVQKENQVYTVDGRCAAVACVDVYLESSAPFSSNPLHCRIHTSTELEYFLPREHMPVRMIAPSELEVSLPPYCARGRLYLGRAVTARKTEFTVEEER